MAAHTESLINRPAIKRTAWKALESHYEKIREVHLRELFAKDPRRGERFISRSENPVSDSSLIAFPRTSRRPLELVLCSPDTIYRNATSFS